MRSIFPEPRAFVGTLVLVSAVSSLTLPQGAVHAAPATVPTPAVSPAPDAGVMFARSPVNLGSHGMVEQEFFFSGTTSVGAYKSRLIVRRPTDAKRFNGSVIVEWMNASSGSDIDVDFLPLLPLMQERGYAYVAVTAQQATVDFLRKRDASRYSTLEMAETLPAQPAAFEVFSQAGKALLANGTGVDPLGGLKARQLIAIGQSQSSSRLTTMVNTVHGLTLEAVYAAYIPHAGGAAPSRFPVPVLKLNSENEAPGYFGSRATTDKLYRYWEVPGTAHSPLESTTYTISLLKMSREDFPTCPFPYQGPGGPVPIDPVLRAAVAHVDAWLQKGEAPPTAPLIDMTPSPTNPKLGVIQRDQYGNALGGIRMPQQVAPTGRNTPSFGCVVNAPPPIGQRALPTFPQWDAFDGGKDPATDPSDTFNANEPANAKVLYGSHAGYVSRFEAATKNLEKQGFILKSDASRLVDEAKRSDVAK